ncbi:MAG: cytochrome C oxidase subunit IV family protein [Planctomycetota bacterium]
MAHDKDHDEDDFAHPAPVWMLLAVFGALTFLTILTVFQATSINAGDFDVLLVMIIATVKAALVIAFFMHMLWDKPFNALFFLGSAVFVALFIILTLGDNAQNADNFIIEADMQTTNPALTANN